MARDAGATVHAASEVLPALGPARGKGEALWKSLHVTTGDVLVFLDADLVEWGPHFVSGLLGPLLTDPGVALVKAVYDRPLLDADGREAETGGRVTELVARPLLALHHPELAGLVQPLAGEWAVRRSAMERFSVPVGYGVEIAALVDTAELLGADAIAQVDLGRRTHRHHRHDTLGPMAVQVLAAVESRLARAGVRPGVGHADAVRPDRRGVHPQPREVDLTERPPALAVEGYRSPPPGGERDEPRCGAAARSARVRADRTASSWRSSTAPRTRSTTRASAGPRMPRSTGCTRSWRRAPTSSTSAASRRPPVRRSTPTRRSAGSSASSSGCVPTTRASSSASTRGAARWHVPCARWGPTSSTTPGAVPTPSCPPWQPSSVPRWSAPTPVGCTPRTRPHRIEYDDVVADVRSSLLRQAERAVSMGVEPERVIIDPAHDFGKNTWHSLEVTRRLDELTTLGWPTLVSLSNKDFVGESLDLPVGERLTGTLAATALCAWHGAQVYRVHEVAETRQVLDMVSVVAGDLAPARTVRGLA